MGVRGGPWRGAGGSYKTWGGRGNERGGGVQNQKIKKSHHLCGLLVFFFLHTITLVGHSTPCWEGIACSAPCVGCPSAP